MAVTQTAKLYGYGSFFRGDRALAKDVDILVLHETVERASIELALLCKASLRAIVPRIHVVMLSEQEERELGFLAKSDAVLLGEVSSASASQQIYALTQGFRQ
jgi:predicted nucleotidyltransferase